MLAFKYKNEFIDVEPGQQMEMTRNSPLFLVENVLGEYSSPVTIKYSEKNVRLFGGYFFDLSIKKKGKFDIEVYDHDTFSFRATLIIETSNINRRQVGKGNAAGYILSGVSNFLNRIKDVKANTLKLGGERTFVHTTNDPTDLSAGYVQHFQNTWSGTYDYITAPIRNDLWTGIPDDPNANGWMNILDGNSNLMAGQAYVLQPKLKYVLECLFNENGWVLDSSAMAGDWDKIFMFSVKPLFTVDVTWVETLVGGIYENIPTAVFKDTISFNLAEWISPEVTCGQLLLEHCKRYGWVPICNNNTNICRLIPLRNAGYGKIKDWTKYASAQVQIDFTSDKKVYSFKNEIPSTDEFPSKPNFDNLTIGAPVLNKAALPSPLGNYDNIVIYAYRENQWFRIVLDAVTNQRKWAVFADNIYDSENENPTTTFDTKISTLPVYNTKYRTAAGIDYYGLFAYCKQSRNKDWGLRTLIYHGMVNEVLVDGTVGLKQYPYLSSIRVLPDGTEIMSWSNVYHHKNGAADYGIIEYWLQAWINLIGLGELDDQRIYLPIHELADFQWDDIINIFNVPYFVFSFLEPRSYQGFIQAKLQKIQLGLADEAGIITTPIYYVELVIENIRHFDSYPSGVALWSNGNIQRLVVYSWLDAAKTIEANPVNLSLNFHQMATLFDNPPFDASGSFIANGHRYVYLADAFKDGTYILTATPNMSVIELLPGMGYIIVP